MTPVEHRAAARIAWRYARKAKARTTLVLFLIALPIAALVGAGIMITTAIANPQDEANKELGSGDLLINFWQGSLPPSRLLKALPAGSVVVETRQQMAYRIVEGSLVPVEVDEPSVPPDQAPIARQFALIEGRMPHAAGEATLPPAVARAR